MDFILVTLGMLAVLFVVLMGLARVFEGHRAADLLDWKPTRSYETEVELEMQDVDQMLAAQNEYRRKRGAQEITEADVRRQAAEDERVRARGRGPFGRPSDDETDES